MNGQHSFHFHEQSSQTVAPLKAVVCQQTAGFAVGNTVYRKQRAGGDRLFACGENWKATNLRRLLADVEADQRALRRLQDELEAHLLAAPATDWREAAEKARFLLNAFGATLTSQNPRRPKLIAAVLADFEPLSGES